MKKFLLSFFLTATLIVQAQDKATYKIFTKEGKASDFTAMMAASAKADLTFFGELHDNAMAHWLELQVMKDLFAQRGSVTLGMEMFEADNQIILDEYLAGLIDEKLLLNEAKVWDNYKNDYKPLVEFARENKQRVIATNVPRRYANIVYKKGIDQLNTLAPEAKNWIATLPITIDLTLPGYRSMIEQMGGHGAPGSADNMARSQAVKDATMAHFILKNKTFPFLHVNGSYHSQNFEGIVWYIKKADAKIKIMTLQVVEQDDIRQLEEANKGLADFIIAVPSDMIKTY
ncbi:MAG: iron-regulated protein [Cytophagia bacterium]|nr:iron-regulated protein [Cytophagia bacterium]NBW39044.1 iron-regulated protein [Cytophagia bacterium]